MCDKEKQCSDSSQKNQKIALSLSKMICSFDPLPYLPKKVNLAAQLAISRCIAQLPRQLAAVHFLPCAVLSFQRNSLQSAKRPRKIGTSRIKERAAAFQAAKGKKTEKCALNRVSRRAIIEKTRIKRPTHGISEQAPPYPSRPLPPAT